MQITAPREPPLRLLLLAWLRYRLSRMKEQPASRLSAADIAARVAGSGHPSGF